MKIALRFMETSTFYSNKKVITKNINKCDGEKVHLIIRITKNYRK